MYPPIEICHRNRYYFFVFSLFFLSSFLFLANYLIKIQTKTKKKNEERGSNLSQSYIIINSTHKQKTDINSIID